MKPLTLLVSLSLLAFTVASCGEDEGGGSAADQTETVSQQEFVDEASQICADANQELNQVKNFRQDGPPIIEDALSDLEDLTPPPDEQETFDQFVQAGQDALQTLQGSGEPPQGDPFGQFTRLGEQLGIDGGCTRAGQTPG